MTATGPNTDPADPDNLLTTTTSPLTTIGSSDIVASAVFNAAFIRRIFCCATGFVAVKRVNDKAFVPYPVVAGQYIDGQIIAVGGTGNGSTAIQVIFEL